MCYIVLICFILFYCAFFNSNIIQKILEKSRNIQKKLKNIGFMWCLVDPLTSRMEGKL
jgi:glucan phosphoethanolaminetransferase (alkaline phosphatase superfamily)